MSTEDSNQFSSTTAHTNALLGLNGNGHSMPHTPISNLLHSTPSSFSNLITAPVSTPQYDHTALFQSFHSSLFDSQTAGNGFTSSSSAATGSAYAPGYLNNLLPHQAVNLNLNMTIQPMAMDHSANTNGHSHAGSAPRMHSSPPSAQMSLPITGPHTRTSPAAFSSTPASSSSSSLSALHTSMYSSSSASSSSPVMSDDPAFLFTVHFVSSPSSSCSSSLRRDQFHHLSSTRLLSSALSLSLRQLFESCSRLLTMSRIWIENDSSGELFEYGRKSTMKSESAGGGGSKDERKKRSKKADKNCESATSVSDEVSVDDGKRRLIELAPIQEKVQKLVNSGQLKAYMHAASNLTPIQPYNDKRKRKNPVQRSGLASQSTSTAAEMDETADNGRHADIRLLHREKGKQNHNSKSDANAASREEKMHDDPDSANQADEDDEDDTRTLSPSASSASSSSSQQSLALSAFSLANVYIELLPTMKECRRLGCVYFMENNLQKSRRCCFYCQSGVELSKSLLRCFVPPSGLLNDQNFDRTLWNEALDKTLLGLERDFWKFTAAPADERSANSNVLMSVSSPPLSANSSAANSPSPLQTLTGFGGNDSVILYFMFVSAQVAQNAEDKFHSICHDLKLIPAGQVKKNSLAFRKVNESAQFFLKMKSHFWTFEVHTLVANPNRSAVSLTSATTAPSASASSPSSSAVVKQISVYRKIGKPNQNRRRSTKASSTSGEKRLATLPVKNEFGMSNTLNGDRRKAATGDRQRDRDKKSPEVRKGKGRSREEDSDSDSGSDNGSDNDDESTQHNYESQKKRKIESGPHSDTAARAGNTAPSGLSSAATASSSSSSSSSLPSLFFFDEHNSDLSLQLSDHRAPPQLTVSQSHTEEFGTNLDEENERSTTSESENSSVNQETATNAQQLQSHPFLQMNMNMHMQEHPPDSMQAFLQPHGNEYSALGILNEQTFFQAHLQQNNGQQTHTHTQSNTQATMHVQRNSMSGFGLAAAIPSALSSVPSTTTSALLQADSKQTHQPQPHHEHELYFAQHEHSHSLTAPPQQTAALACAAVNSINPMNSQQTMLSTLLEPLSSPPPINAFTAPSSSASASSLALAAPNIASALTTSSITSVGGVKHEEEKRVESDSDEMDSVDSSFHSSPNLNISPQSSDGQSNSRPHSVQPPSGVHLNSHALINEALLAQSNIRSEVADNHVSMSQPSYSLLRHQRPVGATLAVKDPNSAYSHLASVPVILLYRDAASLLRELDSNSVAMGLGMGMPVSSSINSPLNDGVGASAGGVVSGSASGFVGGTFQHLGEVRVNVHAVPEVNTDKKRQKNKRNHKHNSKRKTQSQQEATASEDDDAGDNDDEREYDSDGDADAEDGGEKKQHASGVGGGDGYGNGDSDSEHDAAANRRMQQRQHRQRSSRARLVDTRRRGKDLYSDEVTASVVLRWLLRLHMGRWSVFVLFGLALFSLIVFLQGTLSPGTSNPLSVLKHVSSPEISSALEINVISAWTQIRSASVVVDSWARLTYPNGVPASVYFNQSLVDQVCNDAATASGSISNWIAAANFLASAAQPLTAQVVSLNGPGPSFQMPASDIPTVTSADFCASTNSDSARSYIYRMVCSSQLNALSTAKQQCTYGAGGAAAFTYDFCITLANVISSDRIVNFMFLINSQSLHIGEDGILPLNSGVAFDGNSSTLLAASNAVNYYAAQVTSINAARASYDTSYQLWTALPQLSTSVQANSYIILLLQLGSYGLALALLAVLAFILMQYTKHCRYSKKHLSLQHLSSSSAPEEQRLARSPSAAAESDAGGDAHADAHAAHTPLAESASVLYRRSQQSGGPQQVELQLHQSANASAAPPSRSVHIAEKADESKSNVEQQDENVDVEHEQRHRKAGAEAGDVELSGSRTLSLEYEESMNEVSRFLAEKQRNHAQQAQAAVPRRMHAKHRHAAKDKDVYKANAKRETEVSNVRAAEKDQKKDKHKADGEVVEMSKRG